MQFILQWIGIGYPTKAETETLSLPFNGAEQPKEITFLSNSSIIDLSNVHACIIQYIYS